ncbi:MAG: spondin domain-containing protein [Pirellulaceae bacterium]
MKIIRLFTLAGALLCSAVSNAAIVDVTVTFENTAPTNSVSFAPVHVGFNNGTFDSFDINTAAGPEIISIAEGGTGSAWRPAFAAADPTAVLGSGPIGAGGPILPGATRSATFRVDTDVNQFFTFAGMVIPSNDLFIGNDNPTGLRLFDNDGNLLLSELNQTAAQIWDAGSEVANVANAAFLVNGNNDLRVDEGGVVTFEFSELATYDGEQTAAGYTFDSSSIASDTLVGRFSFSSTAVPEPGSASLLGLAAIGMVLRRRRSA